MIFPAKRTASACFTLLAALIAAAIPLSAYAQIPMRGFRSDLFSTDDKFVSLDLNGDGKADMLYYRPGGGFAGAYLSHGDGTFRYVSYANGGDGYNGFPGDLSSTQDTFVPLDLNGDGKTDFIEYRPGSGYTIRCLSNGDGTVNCVLLSQPGQQNFGFKDSMTNGAERIVAMDLNHDGRSDFIVYSPGAGYARAYLSLTNGNVQEVDLTINGSANGSVGFADDMKPATVKIVPIDANGDGYADLLVYTPQYGEVRLYLNNRNSTFQRVDLAYGGSRSGGFTGDAGNTNSHLIALDLNGDGKQDFLWWQAGSRTVIGYLSSGNGSFTAVNYQANGSTANGFQDNDNSTADTAVALDADGDGKQDFLWSSPGNNVATLYLSGASGALNGAVLYGSQLSASRSNGVVLPLNFLGQAASGFVSYVPGSGANGGTPRFNAYTLANTDRQSSILGRLNSYNFYAQPGSFLTDLNWSVNNVPLKEIVMPGTHDAVLYDVGGSSSSYQTQWETIPDQLNDGARFFDFRLAHINFPSPGVPVGDGGTTYLPINASLFLSSAGFYMYGHSYNLTNRSPIDIINQLETWLTAHPSEVIVLDLTTDVNDSSATSFVQQLGNTSYPTMIYTQQRACGAVSCTSAAVQPQNVTVSQLQTLGSRLILINGSLVKTGFAWGGVSTQVGYCEKLGNAIGSTTGGRSTAKAEIDCIDNGNGDGGGPSIRSVRPDYRAADADSGFMALKAVLTPGGGYLPGETISLASPLTLADGADPYGFNVGSNEYDLNNEFLSGHWNVNALNAVYIDGIRANNSNGDQMATLIIQRNKQTWVNTHFFNNRSDNPAGALSIGSNGDIWAAGAGHSISLFKYNRATGTWVTKINGMPNVKRLATDPLGGVWVVDGSQGISSTLGRVIHYDLNGQNPTATNFIAQDVAVGKNGSVWGIDQNGVFEVSGPTDGSRDLRGVYTIQYGTHVAVDNQGFPWVIDNNGHIQKFNGSSWQQVSGSQAKEIAAGVDGSIFIVGYDNPSIGRYNTQYNNFDFLLMDADRITVEPGGQPWAIRHGSGAVYKGSLDQM